MIRYDFEGRAILLSIEGTTCARAFMDDVLIPYAAHQVDPFLRLRWTDPTLVHAREMLARDAGAASFAAWCPCAGDDDEESRRWLCAEILWMMEANAESPGLNALQGLIWEGGYRSGLFRSHVFPDVPPALAAWHAAGLDVHLYSSASAASQRLLFGHTVAGDLTGYIQGYHDTELGPKRAIASYAAIATKLALAPGAVLFLSDSPAELHAARGAGLAAALVERTGNAAATGERPYPCITFFGQVAPMRPFRPMGRSRTGVTASAPNTRP